MGATTLWTRDQVAARILTGDTLIVYHGHLLNIPKKWLDAHPGGSLALLHYVGRDATDEIEANHQDDTLKLIPRYSIGRVELTDGVWAPFVPPIMTGWVRRRASGANHDVWFKEALEVYSTEDTKFTPSSSILLKENTAHTTDLSGPSLASLQPPPTPLSLKQQARQSAAYRKLHKRIIDAGLYKTRYFTGYGPEVARYLLLASTSAYAYSHSWFIASAIFLGLFWHQLVFTAHDLGHMGVTHNWTYDRIIATIIADYIGGLSIGWWVQNHNVHHLVTNHPTHDPDIEHMPFFAISPAFLDSLWSSYYKRTMKLDAFAKFLLRVQHKIFYLVMAFARFNLYANSYTYLYQKAFDTKRARGGWWAWRMEVAGIAFFWVWFGRVLYGCGSWQMALAYLLVSHAVTSPLHVQIVLSHFSMPTGDLGPVESFPHRQMRTTTDVICAEPIEFIHGGLHLQVTHHLFPRLPRHNLRRASALVKQFAKEEGLTYAEFGFVDGNFEVLDTLRHVAEQVKIMGTVAKVEAKEAIEKKMDATDARFGLGGKDKVNGVHASRVIETTF
ncbi:Delta 8-(E)-sphingolipid desaturase [Psilocybe cubensis]|uniref:Delta 8-(E)-sphingolipid desaturase n=2 Tax=Psilocybe cubensis TaxID=181762 RepID=A0A8H8CQX9_PSICU|nr:Delta 8-(E)-sphingolipid desaturase [Psilocybe cubensis]KAH9487001.1 Delta 8-(E)-sphingolipid desaturase [Psilocybe cubensis]